MSEELNADKGDWAEFSEDNKPKSSGGSQNNQSFPKAEFISLKEAGTKRIRLVGSFVKFRRHWNPYGKGVRSHDSMKEQDPAWQAGFYPARRFAINVIDREDGKLKILEAGPTVFEAFYVYKKATGIDPAGPEGPDFAITIEIPKDENGKPDTLHKKYGVTAIEKAPFTAEEKKMLCKTDENGEIIRNDKGKPVSNLWPLSRIFKPMAVDKMMDLWNALPDEKKIAPKRDNDKKQGAKQQKAETSTTEGQITEEPLEAETVATVSDDDLFEASSDGEGGTDLF